jgi:hypothetical protein
MQSKLEKIGIEERKNEILKSDYDLETQYSSTHEDALSTNDPKGKGTGHGGHTHFLPDQTKASTTIDYSNFDTENGGGSYDIEGRNNVGGRNRLTAYSIYSKEHQYGAHLIDSEENLRQGQFRM